MMRRAVLVLVAIAAVACGADDPAPGADVGATESLPADGSQTHPDIVDATLTRTGDAWSLDVTVSSPYDTPERYADGWRVLAPDGTVLGTHDLLHDHAGEQPFTRTMRGLEIPPDVDRITIEGRDLANGYGGGTLTIDVPAETG